MNTLQAGFSRVNITPALGTPLSGYYVSRYAQGVLLICVCFTIRSRKPFARQYALPLV